MQENFQGKKVLITGGLGFIGSNLANRLVGIGAKVQLVDSLIPEYGGNLFNINEIEHKVTVNISDVRDQFSMAYLIKGQDYLFNLAGQTSHMDSMQDPYTDLEINCRAQLSILEACRKNNPDVKVVFASTRQIYGKPTYLPVDEKHPLRPVDINGIHKLAGESYHILYNNVYGIKTSVLRLTNTYGPHMRIKDARQTFLGVWLKAAVRNESFEIWDGRQLRDLTYVDDVVDALLLAAANPAATGMIFNLGGDAPISLKALADILIALNKQGSYTVREFPEDRKRIDIDDYYANYGLIQSTLGWSPKIALEDGIKRTLKFYNLNLDRYL